MISDEVKVDMNIYVPPNITSKYIKENFEHRK